MKLKNKKGFTTTQTVVIDDELTLLLNYYVSQEFIDEQSIDEMTYYILLIESLYQEHLNFRILITRENRVVRTIWAPHLQDNTNIRRV